MQTFTDNCYDSTHQVGTNMAAIENNFAALKSMFSGAAAPSDLVAGMLWYDLTKNLPKMRNEANDAWLGIMHADASHKIWVYRNTAPAGWAIDAAVVDVVLALKGGAQAYNANGGTQAGTWTQPDCTLSAANLPAHTHGSSGNHTHTITTDNGGGATNFQPPNTGTGAPGTSVTTSGTGAHEHTSVGSGTAHNHGTTYRPAAAIGTLQYMDI
jgi:hypothetical protein